MIDKEQCQSCGIVIGGIEEHYISDYRGHRICSWCQTNWSERENLAGRGISFEEFTTGKLNKEENNESLNHK